MKKSNYVYVLITADKYELPRFVSETLEEMAKKVNLTKVALCLALERKSLICGKYRIIKVDTRDLEFNFADYNEFCKTENIKPGHARSIQRFKEYIGGDYDCGL